MSCATQNPCVCPATEIVEVPGAQGEAGQNGTNGTNGINAFTISTTDTTIPAIGNSVTVDVANSSWCAVGQEVFFSDGTNKGHFSVTTIPSSSTVELTFLGETGDSSPAAVIASGATLTPSGVAGTDATTPANTNAIGSGTAYQLTTTPALLNLGTTIPQITIPADGNYILAAWVRYDYNAATFAANRTVTTKIRRTNNTATDITGTTRSFLTEIITTKTFTAQGYVVALIPYAGTTGDVLEVWGSVDTLPSAGSLDCVEASLIAFGTF